METNDCSHEFALFRMQPAFIFISVRALPRVEKARFCHTNLRFQLMKLQRHRAYSPFQNYILLCYGAHSCTITSRYETTDCTHHPIWDGGNISENKYCETAFEMRLVFHQGGRLEFASNEAKQQELCKFHIIALCRMRFSKSALRGIATISF